MVPVSGSAYTYSYAVMGELIAWMVGWALILEYAIAAGAVSVGWSGYFVGWLNTSFNLNIPLTLVRGEHTTAPARAMVERLAEVNPQAAVETLPGIGHMGIVAAPQAVLPSLQRHWSAVMR